MFSVIKTCLSVIMLHRGWAWFIKTTKVGFEPTPLYGLNLKISSAMIGETSERTNGHPTYEDKVIVVPPLSYNNSNVNNSLPVSWPNVEDWTFADHRVRDCFHFGHFSAFYAGITAPRYQHYTFFYYSMMMLSTWN